MARHEISDKIRAHLARHSPMTEECHVLYLLVAIRKSTEQLGDSIDPILKFYCDWALHPLKNQLSPTMSATIEKLCSAAEQELLIGAKTNDFLEFGRMSELQGVLWTWLRTENLPTNLVDEKPCWTAFVTLLIEVLAHQPIIPKNSPNVRGLHFQPSTGCCVISFKNPIGGKAAFKSDEASP